MIKVFVDGQDGTTGLQIHKRLSLYDNIEVMKIDPSLKKDQEEKKKFLNEADIVFLCLPDHAAKASVALIDNPDTRVIDASTAHRTSDEWAYGLPELSETYRSNIKNGTRIANPGCHATAVALSLHPLIKLGIINKDCPLAIQSLTGYSGGGKGLISKYEDGSKDSLYHKGARHYALDLNHKHIPEIMKHSGLNTAPVFVPMVDNYYKGLVSTISLMPGLMNNLHTPRQIQSVLANYYKDCYFVRVHGYQDQDHLFDKAFSVTGSNDTNFADLFVYGNEDTGNVLLMCRIDNLGKGASGAAIQNMNLLLGFDEWKNLL